MSDFTLKAFRVTVNGYGNELYYTTSRGQALAKAWRADIFEGWTFGQFLKIANARREEPHPRFGEPIAVSGNPAYLVSWNSQYIQFVRPGSDVILNSHPLDVFPPEARRGTPYHVLSTTGAAEGGE
ncbi:MAG: hypothetical protein ABS87_01090 [Sphingomonas sp. SCN 67-18]|uniref:hypothetical protein n=1 Tax=uncultured Sphingomonas sp. TaxID=158754 RepID=UPI00086D1B07|nr:hypothetical protein [Sphingomonas sp. SCN 67-18]ODU22794.1 MAG: hypothetical protein ABS87_01090 [Sphingomonas sp. SCN 67-18]